MPALEHALSVYTPISMVGSRLGQTGHNCRRFKQIQCDFLKKNCSVIIASSPTPTRLDCFLHFLTKVILMGLLTQGNDFFGIDSDQSNLFLKILLLSQTLMKLNLFLPAVLGTNHVSHFEILKAISSAASKSCTLNVIEFS